jgi:hypothetical protein
MTAASLQIVQSTRSPGPSLLPPTRPAATMVPPGKNAKNALFGPCRSFPTHDTQDFLGGRAVEKLN